MAAAYCRRLASAVTLWTHCYCNRQQHHLGLRVRLIAIGLPRKSDILACSGTDGDRVFGDMHALMVSAERLEWVPVHSNGWLVSILLFTLNDIDDYEQDGCPAVAACTRRCVWDRCLLCTVVLTATGSDMTSCAFQQVSEPSWRVVIVRLMLFGQTAKFGPNLRLATRHPRAPRTLCVRTSATSGLCYTVGWVATATCFETCTCVIYVRL